MVTTRRRRALRVVAIAAILIAAATWFVGRPVLYVILDSNEPQVAPSANLIELLPLGARVVAQREYMPSDTRGYGLHVTVIEPEGGGEFQVGDVLTTYTNRGWYQLGPAAVGHDEGCISATPVSDYLVDQSEDESRKSWVREVARADYERALVITLSRC